MRQDHIFAGKPLPLSAFVCRATAEDENQNHQICKMDQKAFKSVDKLTVSKSLDLVEDRPPVRCLASQLKMFEDSQLGDSDQGSFHHLRILLRQQICLGQNGLMRGGDFVNQRALATSVL